MNATWKAHRALCSAVDAISPAFENLTAAERKTAQAIVERIEALRDTVSARASREDDKAACRR
jgi:hypothetical protein